MVGNSFCWYIQLPSQMSGSTTTLFRTGRGMTRPKPCGSRTDTKECVGYLTGARYLVFVKAGYALIAGNATHQSISPAVPSHTEMKQR